MLKELNYIFRGKDKVKMVFILFGIIIGSFLELTGVAIFTPFINVLMDPESISEKWYLKSIYDLFHFQSSDYFLAALTGSIIFIYVFTNCINFILCAAKAV